MRGACVCAAAHAVCLIERRCGGSGGARARLVANEEAALIALLEERLLQPELRLEGDGISVRDAAMA